ncbi:MAG TPA: carboxypeptidase-like regulatory domain-containing protein [Polyangiaceae bacterium]|nr:carboxypeptidase-like regulatory domain-containing protein [Polyangiaceae bacterium]
MRKGDCGMVSPNLGRLGLTKLLMCAVTFAAASAACDPYVTVTGVVQDESGAPIQGVIVELETAGRTPHRTETTSNGSFHVGMVGADPRSTSVSFRKEGFQDVRRNVGKKPRPNINVILVPLPVQ